MSSTTYSGYYIFPRRRQELEEERKQRIEEERRKQEELRKKELEFRQKREIEAEKQRISLLRNIQSIIFTDKNYELQRQKNDSILTEDVEKNEKQMKEEMEQVIIDIKAILEKITDEYRDFLGKDFMALCSSVEEIEKNVGDPFFYNRLKWARRDLLQLVAGAEKNLLERRQELARARDVVEELLLEVRLVEKITSDEDLKLISGNLLKVLNGISEEEDLSKLITRIPGLQKEVSDLLSTFEEVHAREQARRFVLKNLQEVIAGMGYEPIMPNATGEVFNSGLTYRYFKTPDREAVKVVLGLDNSIYTEFVHLVEEGKGTAPSLSNEKLIEKCCCWCSDFDQAAQVIKEKGVVMAERWRRSPYEGAFPTLKINSGLQDEDEEICSDHKHLQRKI